MNVLIVDDQERILDAISTLVNWEKLKVEQVFTADSAQAAKEILRRERIDIMLTDIEMPGEDGIALHRWQTREYPAVVCIFLTSHADFSYAKEAIHNGAFDYILQPAAIHEIEEVFTRCIRHVEKKKLLEQKSSRYDLQTPERLKAHVLAMFHQKDLFSQMEEWRQDSCTEGESWWYLPCLAEVWQVEIKIISGLLDKVLEEVFMGREGIFFASCELNAQQIGILLYGNGEMKELPFMKELLYYAFMQMEQECGCEWNLYMGQYAEKDLPNQIRLIFDFCTGRISKKNEVYLLEMKKSIQLRKPDGMVWSRWLIRGDTVLVRNQVRNLLQYAQEEHLTIGYMQQIIRAFVEACTIACHEQQRNMTEIFVESFDYEKMMNERFSIQELEEKVDLCLKQYESILSEKEDRRDHYSVKERMQEILVYLDDNMEQMISRRDAAKYVFLNEDYFSRVFLKETGMRYKEYVLKHKMDYAGKLLTETDLPVTLIASKVGYENFAHFTKMFRKIIGVSPTIYRKKHQEQDRS